MALYVILHVCVLVTHLPKELVLAAAAPCPWPLSRCVASTSPPDRHVPTGITCRTGQGKGKGNRRGVRRGRAGQGEGE